MLSYPRDRLQLNQVVPSYVVIVMEKGTRVTDVIRLAEMGFGHFVRADREDFPRELLAAGLMATRPAAFARNPLPFFFNGFRGPDPADPDRNLTLKIQDSTQKSTVLDWLDIFLQQNPRVSGIRELCLQAADEMILNALYNAPVKSTGVRPFQAWSRTQPVVLPASHAATLFAAVSDERVVIGCTDAYGSLARETLIASLGQMFGEAKVQPRSGHAGAGMGLRYLIENAANFYLIVRPQVQTLVAAAFRLEGLRANLEAAKHFHFSFGENIQKP